MLTWFLASRLGRALAAIGAAVVAVLTFGAIQRSKGRSEAIQEAKDEDYENAADIRNRVERDLDQRLREFDGRGYRDE